MRRIVACLVLSLVMVGCRPGARIPAKPAAPPAKHAVPSAPKPAFAAAKPTAAPNAVSPVPTQGGSANRKAPSTRPSLWREIREEIIQQLVEEFLRRQQQSSLDSSAFAPGGLNSTQNLDAETAYVTLIHLEMTKALAERRAFAWNNGAVRLLGIQPIKRIYVDQLGISYLVVQVQSSSNPDLLPGDVIFAVDGIFFAPGRDLAVLVNRPDAPATPVLLVLRHGNFVLVPIRTVVAFPTPQEINLRRICDATERVWLEERVLKGEIANPAWLLP
ncbi:hypothetical protein HRbin36_01117 [bacterium HR36]|nr:hypothetical protein HRbin36_01117 [bacterium HR36]